MHGGFPQESEKRHMDQFRINLSLVALIACLAYVGWAVMCVLVGRKQSAISTFVVVLVSCILLFAAGVNWSAGTSFPLPEVSGLVVLFAIIASLTARFGLGKLGGRDWNVAVAHALLVAAAAWNCHSSTLHETWDFADLKQPTKVPINDAVVVTDQGRIFSVFRFDTDRRGSDQRVQRMFEKRIIRVASEDAQTNCHGWVFTGGRYGIPSAAVDAVLQDNGYSAAASPERGDVIVYRDEAGSIVHSGCVRRVHEDGQVWIESKWGPGGRYLHRPEDQCYSSAFTYFRSARATHEVRIVQTPMTNDGRVARSIGPPSRRARG
jgi:hypothetical protein